MPEEKTEYNKYQVVLSGGRSDSLSLYMLAKNDIEANAYADEVSSKMGFTVVSISDLKTSQDRQERGIGNYSFDFPSDDEMQVIDAPKVIDGELRMPRFVLRVSSEEMQQLLDPKEQLKRQQEERMAARRERRSRAISLSTKE